MLSNTTEIQEFFDQLNKAPQHVQLRIFISGAQMCMAWYGMVGVETFTVYFTHNSGEKSHAGKSTMALCLLSAMVQVSMYDISIC